MSGLPLLVSLASNLFLFGCHCFCQAGEAVAEFFVHRRMEVDSTTWCLVQVTEQVDVEAPNAEPPLAAVSSSAGTDSAKTDSETNPADGEENKANTESKIDGGKPEDSSKEPAPPPVRRPALHFFLWLN
jgi:hypothetical protein